MGNLCDAIQKLGNFKDDAAAEQQGERAITSSCASLGTLTAISSRSSPALAGSGMIRGSAGAAGGYPCHQQQLQTYAIFYAFGNALFSFMPFILAYSAAKHFACNPYISATLAGVLLHAAYRAEHRRPGIAVGFIRSPWCPTAVLSCPSC